MIRTIKLFCLQNREVKSFYHQIYPFFQATAAPDSLQDCLLSRCTSVKIL